MTVYVYSGHVDKELLVSLISDFFAGEEAFHISPTIESYKPEIGLPSQTGSKGQVFSKNGEIRWEEEGGKYLVILLSETEFTSFQDALTSLGGFWETEEKMIYLTPPDAPHVSPNFDKYPTQTDDKVPKMKVTVFYHEGIATFVSPRGFEK